MKLLSGAFAAAILAAALATGCSEPPQRYSSEIHQNSTEIHQSLDVGPKRTIEVGESARLMATSHNLIGVKQLTWTVTPSVGKVTVEKYADSQTALFSADQPGVYVITASADLGNGRVISSDTTVTVNGRPIVSDRDTIQR